MNKEDCKWMQRDIIDGVSECEGCYYDSALEGCPIGLYENLFCLELDESEGSEGVNNIFSTEEEVERIERIYRK